MNADKTAATKTNMQIALNDFFIKLLISHEIQKIPWENSLKILNHDKYFTIFTNKRNI